MAKEFWAFQQTCTWDIVPHLAGAQPVSCKWIFEVKHRPDGSIKQHKAHLVARGFNQEHGIDYNETFDISLYIR